MSNGSSGIGRILGGLGSMLGLGGGTIDPDRQMVLEVLFGLLGYLAKLDSLITSHEAEDLVEEAAARRAREPDPLDPH